MKVAKILLFLLIFHAPDTWARMRDRMHYPEPPIHSPNPPTSAEARLRVDFAVAQIRAKYGPNLEIRHPHVIPWSFEKFEKNRKANPSAAENPSGAREELQDDAAPESAKEKMKAPVLKPDEFMVHVYVRDLPSGHWRHLDVILSEDNAGRLVLRGFFDIAMPENPWTLPSGVRC